MELYSFGTPARLANGHLRGIIVWSLGWDAPLPLRPEDGHMALNIRTRIVLFQLTIAGAVMLMAVAVYFSFRSFDYYFTRVSWSYEQLSKMTKLASRANRYSEQIAELLLVGAEERSDYESAWAELQEVLDDLRALQQGEFAILTDAAVREQNGIEAERLRRITTLLDEIAREVERLFAMREAGRQEEAIRLFRSEIENRLDAELEQLIAEGVADEVDQVQEADEQFLAMSETLRFLVGTALAVALGASAISGYFLYRSLAGPIRRLTEGTVALERGKLAHRVGDLGNDELGLLARRFDAMAGQLHSARTHLEEQVRQRTAELEDLNERLREVDRLRVRFLADVSHELRTPLTALRGEAEVTLRGTGLPQEAYRETLSRIVDQASDMGDLIDDLLFLARSETDQIPFERERLDLSALVQEAAGEARPLGSSRGVMIETTCPDGRVALEGDRQRLKQTLLIVLDNAVKYAAAGSTVELRLKPQGEEAEIVVRNHGHGIAQDDLPHVFERFYRGKSRAARRKSGSGLGLSIAKWIVEKHDGSISLDSDEAGWTEARIRFPRRVDEPVAASPAEA